MSQAIDLKTDEMKAEITAAVKKVEGALSYSRILAEVLREDAVRLANKRSTDDAISRKLAFRIENVVRQDLTDDEKLSLIAECVIAVSKLRDSL